jgi:ABC-type transport system involved in cytochrome bd biosynthesis fused ATPase/permease subunit
MLYATEALNASSSGWMNEVKIEDGKFYFREYGAWVTAVEASGAQEAFLGSALRIGLNKALYRGDAFMVFDEPTDGMREDNARNLVAEIGNCAGQVLVITHRESDQGLANNIIEV